MTRRYLVLGIGNPLQGADAFGPAVVDRLRASGRLPANVELVEAGTDLLSHLDRLAEFDHVVVVDACLGGGRGEVVTVEESTFATWSAESPGSHDISALIALGLFRRLHPDARTRISVVGLDVDRITRDQTLTRDAVEAGIAAVLRIVAR